MALTETRLATCEGIAEDVLAGGGSGETAKCVAGFLLELASEFKQVRLDLDPKVLAEIKTREGLDFEAALFLCRLMECYRAANPNQPVLPMTWRMKTGSNDGDYIATVEITSDGRSRFEARGTTAQIWDAFEYRFTVEHA